MHTGVTMLLGTGGVVLPAFWQLLILSLPHNALPLQVKQMGLKKALSSPNGAMRKGWNGITISRDTIHIPGIELGFKV